MKRKQYSASSKVKVVLVAIRGLKTTNEIAAEFGFHLSQIGYCKKQVIESFAYNRGLEDYFELYPEGTPPRQH